ncbi:MAG: glucosaminidase domain-containing protein [Faecalicatena sp.]|uniref:glucosaminidase domain-containing protein n=1 Tax=Faecalicatena sp. TaxID=2005360 RepID=UPI0025879CDD|nr:glucosaminidase domain-containing protein [Faecalicatena sp.]MCI6465873.1 glucosaminidase domain-containing protein [Faecalicatena sp.]MDY5618711.1 glucosaminidase domain-containing protein [Lachnospiraceae bacterium]
MKKRIMSVILSLCLSFGTVSAMRIQVMAEEVTESTQQQVPDGSEAGQVGDANDVAINEEQGLSDGETQTNEQVEPAEQGETDEQFNSEEPDMKEEVPQEEKVEPVQIPCMDEEGNIFYITDDVSPSVKSVEYRSARAVNDYIVNLRVKKNGTVVNDITKYTEFGTGDEGYLYGLSGTDAAYLGTDEKGRVKFMISGVIGLVNASEVQLVNRKNVAMVSSYYADGTNIIHRICLNMNSGASASLKVGPQQSYMSAGTTYYSYDGHYFYTDYSVMLADYKNNTRKQSINPNNPYYNYYQYLPFRSTTVYSASQLNSKINARTDSSSKMWNIGNSMVSHQNTYGVNALLMAGLAANESAWGKSPIAQSKNNLFGLNAVDSSPGASANSYSNPDACVRNFAEGWMSKRYLNPKNSNYYGGYFGNKASGINVKYASDPYWGEKAANIAWNLDSDGSDRFKYTIGVKDADGIGHTDVNVRKDSNTSSANIFTTGTQTSQAFLLLGELNGFYKIQSDPVLNSNRTAISDGSGKYDFSSMYLYMSKGNVIPVSGKMDFAAPGTSGSSGNTDNSGSSGNSGNNTSHTNADTLAVRRGATYYFKYSLSNGAADLTFSYGRAGDEVLIGDWNGDGVDTLCVRRGNLYYFKNSLSSGPADYVVRYGREGDEVYAGDWNGDGIDTLCVRRGNIYYIKNSMSGGVADITIPYGRVGDKVLIGDWDGNGTDTICVRRENTYYFKNSLTSGVADATIPYGRVGDKVLAGDWNGDGRDTLCVRRDNAYYIKNSISSGVADKVVLYGRTNDVTYAGTWR